MRVLTLILLSVFVPSVAAQAKVYCSFCKDHGFKECKRHKKAALELESKVLYCSAAAECPDCAGVLQQDCKHCRNAPVEASAQQRKDLVATWREGRRAEVDKYTKSQGILHGRTQHVALTFGLARMKVGKRVLSTHELMHLYLERMEALYADFCKVLEVTDKDFSAPIELYVFEKQVDHEEIAPRKTHAGAGRGSGRKFMGESMVFSMWKAPHVFRDDEDVHRYLAHNVAHLMLNHVVPHNFIYNKGHGWLDAGIAHWFEMRVGGMCTTFCYEEIALDAGVGFKRGVWKPAVRKLVDEGQAGGFAEFYQLNTDQLSLPAHALSFAYVDYLIAEHGGSKLRDILRAVKNGVPTRDALQKACGLTPLSIDEGFRQFVKKTYPRRAPERRK